MIAFGVIASNGGRINFSAPEKNRGPWQTVHAESLGDLIKLAPTEIRLSTLSKPDAVVPSLLAFKNSLNSLDLNNNSFSHDSFHRLSMLTNCEDLSLFHVPVVDADFERICNSLPLRSLDLSAELLTPEAILALDKLKWLEELRLFDARLDLPSAAAIGRCVKLRHLTISGSTVSDVEISQLRPLIKLTELGINGTLASNESAPWIATLLNLKELKIAGTQMTMAGVAQFKSLSQLETLIAYGLKPAPQIKVNWAEWSTNLKVLNLSNTRLGEGGLRGLGKLANLEELNIEDTDISDDDITQLKGLRRLNQLEVNGTPMSDALVKEILPSLSSLMTLGADDTDISDQSLEVFFRHPALQSVTIRWTKITQNGARQLMKHFRIGPGIWAPRR